MATMENVAIDAAVAAAEMPRFDDGCASMRELARLPIEKVVNAAMDAMAEAAAEDAGTCRDGCRRRTLNTCVGTLELRVPKPRAGTFFPGDAIECHSRTDRAMVAAVVEMHRGGVSTREVSDVAEALGAADLSKDRASRICARLDAEVEDMDGRPFGAGARFPHAWLDAAYVKCRGDGRVASTAVVTAIACGEEGNRCVVGFDVVDTEPYGSWLPFLRGLRERGVDGVMLVVSDAHGGLARAVSGVSRGAAWQRRAVHLMRDCCEAARSKSKRAHVARPPSPVLGAKDAPTVRAAHHRVAEIAAAFCPTAAEILDGAEAGALACLDFPPSHWRRLRADSVQERADRETRRRSRVAQAFPGVASLMRLAGAVMADVGESWQRARCFSRDRMDELWAPGEDAPAWLALATKEDVAAAEIAAERIAAAAEAEIEGRAARWKTERRRSCWRRACPAVSRRSSARNAPDAARGALGPKRARGRSSQESPQRRNSPGCWRQS